MKTKDFDFELPSELIAQYPLANRADSRLLHYTRATRTIEHTHFKSLIDRLNPGDLLVMNNTEVMPARLYGQKSTGGRIELLIERLLPEKTFLTLIKASKAPKPGTQIILDGEWTVEVLEKQENLYLCKLITEGSVDEMLHAVGHIPLPPYIAREDKATDFERYQTVYAKHKGSVAAPTAGLHFDEDVLNQIKNKGIGIAYVTLHVGAGTFQPVRAETLKEHHMHTEHFEIDEALCDAISQTKKTGGRVISVGTTTLRSLESAAQKGPLKPQAMDTNIFIYPGFVFKVCDGLITNFHLPQSTLLMLVSAFIGHAETMALYKEAIEKKYRFFSYGDATLLL
ncbi:MAG: tRNA preQ1(34) S-adenosylmethionine ribosyltransferase-isomerase QueA [Gammaproteobacteria bacterium]|nr:tRNA preQ1(34) S-adenosylmethionine ribosyltransferase-isomerase QueA [Gammaproteobacteria bacterium]